MAKMPKGHHFRWSFRISSACISWLFWKVLAALIKTFIGLDISYFSVKEVCMYLHWFYFTSESVVYLCSAAEVKVPVEVPVEVCLLLPFLRFEVLLITKTTWETLHSEKQGTRPEPQTHKHRSETYDLIWREGHVQGHTQICRCCCCCTALPSHTGLPCSWCTTTSFIWGAEVT